MKKVAILHYAYYPNIGGVEILLREHAQILTELGYDTLVITGSGKEEPGSKIKVLEVKEFQSVMNFNPELQEKILEKGIIDDDFYHLSADIEKKLDDCLRDRDTVIVHNMLTVYRNLPFIYAFREYCKKHPGQKIIIWVHDHMYVGFEKIRTEEVAVTDLEKQLLTTPLPNVTYVAISETFKKLLVQVLQIDPEKVIVIPDGLNMRKFLEIDDSIWTVVRKMHFLESYPMIISPVNLLERKNLEYSIDIVNSLKQSLPNIHYVITGKHSLHRSTVDYVQKLKKQIADLQLESNITFLGSLFDRSLSDAEMHDLYSLSDLVFYFSKSENFGLPILEAAATKTPIFLSTLKVFKEVGTDNLHYIDPDKQTPEEVCKIIKHFLENDKIITMNNLVKRKYNLENIIQSRLVPLL